MVFMMRNLIILFCLFSTFAYAAEPAGDQAKAELVKEVPLIKGAQKLLGSSGERLYFGAKESVLVVDLEGKLLQTLQAKEGSDSVFKKPEAVALGAGVVYVADSETNLVAMFSAEGKYEGSLGAKKGGFFGSGGAEHELKKPLGVAVHEGIVYVLDSETKRILMFGSTGTYLSPLELKPSSVAKLAKEQGETYKLSKPVALQVDVLGRFYVLDAEDSLIKSYSANGEYLRALPWDGELNNFVVAQDGLYVAKNTDATVQKYDFNHKSQYHFGGKGKEVGLFKELSGLAVVNGRQVAVADTGKGVVNYFVGEAHSPLEVIPKSAGRVFVQSVGEIPAPVGKIAWDGKDTLYGVDAEQKAVAVIRGGKVVSQIKIKDVVPVAVAVDAAGTLYMLEEKYRVLKLDASGKILSSFGSEGSGDGQFDEPTDLVFAAGKFYVADKGNDSVQIFDADGKFLSAIRKLEDPTALAVDAQENIYVLGKGRVAAYSPQGKLTATLGKGKEDQAGSLLKPVALMVMYDEVSVLDGNQVKVYSRKGEYLRTFGAKGRGRGELEEPVAIIPKDDVSFYIAELGNKRIQSFITQYKVPAPQQLTAVDGLHSIELKWDALDLPYVKQYQVYRSKTENGGYARVATVDKNQYIDRGLEPDGKYFYRVGAETRMGYEGATSLAASATSKRYTPPALSEVKVEVTSWKIKLNWQPIESEFLSSYFIYQKEGNNFTKVAEVLTPEFTKEGLAPGSKHTYYIAAHSTDGTDAEKVEVTATTQAFSKAPLEIEVLSMRPIFSNTYKLYEQDGVGSVRLTNNTDKPMESVTLSFLLKDFMDFATESKLEKLLSGQSVEVKLKAVFNNNILNVTEDTSVQTMLEASYFDSGKRESFSKNTTVSVYEKHKLLWDERERYASFITPKDAPVLTFVRSVVGMYKDTKDESQLAAAVFNALGVYGMTYIQDPTNPYQVISGKTNVVDYIQFPRETLERKSGDCDDLVAFYTSALESMGIETRVVEVPGHMFMMFSTGVHAEGDGYTMDEMYVIYEDKLWIPVETTVVGSSFIKAWELGAEGHGTRLSNL